MLHCLPFLALTSYSSRLERISTFQHAEPFASVAPARRRLEAAAPLTAANTRPLRFALDFASLYPETAPQYTACFAVGDWYRRGLPRGQTTPPAVETCDANGDGSDCWGRCRAEDLITPAARDLMVQVVTELADELSELFAVRATSERLSFSVSKGRYQRAVLEQGWTPVEGCASDCTLISGAAVDATKYCTQGVDADAVLSLRRPPSEAQIAGTGSHCQVDALGRPTWLIFNWISPTATLSGTVATLVSEYRALVYHEVIHALGFANTMFLNARDATGHKRRLLERVLVTDTDGATDEVWHFVRGRAYETAQLYFGCTNATGTWHGLPLMGLPEIGRASHWETRVMRDDVMSYGGRATVSSITLAAMEDLGFYVANYSRAGCMNWGYQQGCAYVTSRCGTGTNDQSALPSSSSQCGGDPAWSTPDEYISSKCAGGTTPCSTLTAAGFTSAGGTLRCNAQCYTPTDGRSDCNVAPTAPVEGAAESDLFGITIPQQWLQWLLLGAWGLGALAFLACWRDCCCPKKGAKGLVVSFSVLLGVAGVLLCAFCSYSLYYAYAHVEGHLEEIVNAYVGKTTLYVGAGTGGFLALLALLTLCGVCCRGRVLLCVSFVVYVLLLLVQIVLTILVLYWISSLDDITNDSLQALRGDAGGLHAGKFGAEALSEAEGLTCRTYQTCCRDPTLALAASGANATCRTAHEGSASAITLALDDPSHPDFCAFVSGARLSFTPAAGVCDLLELSLDDHSMSQCQSDFCPSGIDGYFAFVQKVVRFMRRYGYFIGAGLAVVALVQLTILVNLWNLRKRFRNDRKRVHQVQPSGTQPGKKAAR